MYINIAINCLLKRVCELLDQSCDCNLGMLGGAGGARSGAVLLSGIVGDSDGKVPVATRANNVQFRDMVKPGDMVEIEVELTERLADAFFMKAKVKNVTSGKLACRFEFACTLAPKRDER